MRVARISLVIATLGLAAAGLAMAQSGHTHHPGGTGIVQPHHRVEAMLREFDEVVADGRGFGLAFPADQNGYPGPLHVLELKEPLRLTDVQETRMTSLFDAMLAEARIKAGRLAAAEARLRRLFADGVADAATVRAAVAAAEAARTELRLVHLLTHLETRDVLTETQRQAYHQLRWGPAKNR